MIDGRAEAAQKVVANHPLALDHMCEVHQLHPWRAAATGRGHRTGIVAQQGRRPIELV